jgi:hypothetical protein
MQKNLRGGEGIAAGPMPLKDWNRKMFGNGVQTIVVETGNHTPRERNCTEVRIDHAVARIHA